MKSIIKYFQTSLILESFNFQTIEVYVKRLEPFFGLSDVDLRKNFRLLGTKFNSIPIDDIKEALVKLEETLIFRVKDILRRETGITINKIHDSVYKFIYLSPKTKLLDHLETFTNNKSELFTYMLFLSIALKNKMDRPKTKMKPAELIKAARQVTLDKYLINRKMSPLSSTTREHFNFFLIAFPVLATLSKFVTTQKTIFEIPLRVALAYMMIIIGSYTRMVLKNLPEEEQIPEEQE